MRASRIASNRRSDDSILSRISPSGLRIIMRHTPYRLHANRAHATRLRLRITNPSILPQIPTTTSDRIRQVPAHH